jgi:hypothetical protein
MLDIRPSLRAYLLADAAIAAAVIDRVYTIKIPQGVSATCIVYTRISGGGDYHLQGLSGFARHRYQIDSWAPTANGAASLADLIRDRIDGFRGVMGDVTVHGIFFQDQREDYDDEARLHRTGRDYFIDFAEL